MRDFNHALLRLKAALGVTEDQEVADALGMSKATFSARKVRGSFPEDKVRALAASRPGLDVDYVLYGHDAKRMAEQRESRHTVFVSSGAGDAKTVREVVKRYLPETSARDRLAHGLPVNRQEAYAELGQALDGLDDAALLLVLCLVERLAMTKEPG